DHAENPASTALRTLTVDATTPAAPSAPDLAAAADTGASSTDNVTQLATLNFTGTAQTGSTVTILSDGIAVGSGIATGASYSITTAALAAGTHSITATASDPAGNVSPVSAALAVTVDTTPPPAPSVPDLDAASDTGVSNTDNVTEVTTP